MKMSAGIGLMIPCVLLLLNSGAVLADQVVNGTLGGSVYFYESIPIDADPVIQWTFKNTLIAQRFPGNSPVCLNQFTGRCSLYVNGTLRLEDLRSSDDGDYTLSAQYPNSTFLKQSTYRLRVYTPVSDVKLTSNASELVWPGLDSVSLNCSARGADVSYSWSLQGAPLPPNPNYYLSENNTVLTISPVSDKDNETFTCTAKNWINSVTSNGVSFNLASPVSSVTLTSNTLGSYIWAGEESVTLHCSAKGSAITFLWKLNGEPLPADSRYYLSHGDSPPHSNLFISPVYRNDTGNFTCEASNLLGNEESNALSLNLAWKPEDKMQCTVGPIGQDVELGCSWSGGQPAANVSLIFGNITDTKTNNITSKVPYNILRGSTLTCLGDQLGRTSQCEIVFEIPKAQGHNNEKITETTVGGTLVLTLNLVNGLPANFTWTTPEGILTNRKVENTNSSSILRISDVTKKDAGKYECIAKNIIGSQTFAFNVQVKKYGLGGGEIAGIVIGVLAALFLIGIIVFFIVKKNKRSADNKRLNEPEDHLDFPTYATVNKQNGGVAETSMTNKQEDDKDDVKYAVLNFPNNSSIKGTSPPPVETEYSTVKSASQR